MTAKCPGGDALEAYARGNASPEIEEHVAECSDCAAVVEIVQQLETLGIVEDVDRYLAQVDALVEEITAAPRDRWPELLQDGAYQRTDVARRLLARGLHERWRDAALAIALTGAAATIADRLRSDAQDLADLRFDSWKYHSALLRESGRYTESRGALVRAEEASAHATDPELAEAAILFSRALLAMERDVWEPEEALALLDVVEPIYFRRDLERWRAARSARATLLYRRGDPACIAVYEEVLAGTPRSDHGAYDDALMNVLIGRIEFGDGSAEMDLLLAELESEHAEHNARALLARDQWLRGKLLALRGEHQQGLESFQTALGRYRRLGNDDAAVRVGIDALGSLVALDEYEEAVSLCRDLAAWSSRLDQHEPSRRRALTAQVTYYMRELAQRSMLTGDIVAEVRRYIQKINNQWPVPFVPPIPLYPV